MAILGIVSLLCVTATGIVPNGNFENGREAWMLGDGVPDCWNAGGYFSFNAFRRGAHEGKFYRIAPEEKSPVPDTKVLFVDELGFTELKTGPLMGDMDYVFSVYMRSDKKNAKVSLVFMGGNGKRATPSSREFTLTSEWQRIVLPFRLTTSVNEFYATIKYNKNPLYMAAPMLHAGSEPVEWRPNPGDAMLPDLRLGRKGGGSAADDKPRELTVPEAEENVFGTNVPDLPAAGYPIDRHDAQGMLSFSGGSMSIAGSVILGADGSGTLERVGTNGTITIGRDLVFSNTVENAESGGTLAFRLDDSGMVEPIAIGGKVVFGSNAKITVDTGYIKHENVKGTLLMASGGVVGKFDASSVVFTGADAQGMMARWTEDGSLKISKGNGSLISFR